MNKEQFLKLPVADKLRRINENIKNNKQIGEIKNMNEIFPDLNVKL